VAKVANKLVYRLNNYQINIYLTKAHDKCIADNKNDVSVDLAGILNVEVGQSNE